MARDVHSAHAARQPPHFDTCDIIPNQAVKFPLQSCMMHMRGLPVAPYLSKGCRRFISHLLPILISHRLPHMAALIALFTLILCKEQQLAQSGVD